MILCKFYVDPAAGVSKEYALTIAREVFYWNLDRCVDHEAKDSKKPEAKLFKIKGNYVWLHLILLSRFL